MARVELQDVTRRFGNVTAIANIAFEVPDGEFWVLVGPSGCGKSTILRAIAGLESISEGNLYIGDTRMNNVPARARDVAMVFQNYALYPHMSVAENIAFGLRMRKVASDTEIEKRVEKVGQSLGIAHLLDRKPKQLSGGQQQRVALGRAIARQPRVFLMDEPLSNLDAQLRDETRAELKRLHGEIGVTTIYVTHDQVEAMTLADRIVVLNEGYVQQVGTPSQIYDLPANRTVATFVGNPAMNVFPAIYSEGVFRLKQQTISLLPALQQQLDKERRYELGIRPEAIAVVSPHVFSKSAEPAQTKLQVEVDVVEPLGRETLIRALLPGTSIPLNFYAEGTWNGRRGDAIEIEFPLEALFIFDAETGMRVYPVE